MAIFTFCGSFEDVKIANFEFKTIFWSLKISQTWFQIRPRSIKTSFHQNGRQPIRFVYFSCTHKCNQNVLKDNFRIEIDILIKKCFVLGQFRDVNFQKINDVIKVSHN